MATPNRWETKVPRGTAETRRPWRSVGTIGLVTVVALVSTVASWSMMKRGDRAHDAGETVVKASPAGAVRMRLECPDLGIGMGEGELCVGLDGRGSLVRIGEGNQEVPVLPVFRFHPVQGLAIGKVPEDAVFALAGAIAERWLVDWKVRLGSVREIRQEGPGIVILETETGVTLAFLAEDEGRQFRNLEEIWRQAEEQGRKFRSVDLVPARNIPVTFH